MDSGIDSDSVKVTTVVGVDRAVAFYIFMHEVDFWRKRGPRYRVDPSRGSCMTFEPHVGGRFLEVYVRTRAISSSTAKCSPGSRTSASYSSCAGAT